jgi:hypothetical protein
MATAILTVLYPTEFSVYDVRVCKQLNDFKGLAGLQFSERLRQEFQRYLGAVHSAAPKGLSLRDKDRYLWGRSFYEGVLKDLRNVKRDREGGKRRDDQAGDELAAGHCLSSHHPRFGPFARTASRFASPMSGTTTASIGFAATATRTGSFNADGLMQRRIASINDLPIGGNFSA